MDTSQPLVQQANRTELSIEKKTVRKEENPISGLLNGRSQDLPDKFDGLSVYTMMVQVLHASLNSNKNPCQS
jgi:hypothetical protein